MSIFIEKPLKVKAFKWEGGDLKTYFKKHPWVEELTNKEYYCKTGKVKEKGHDILEVGSKNGFFKIPPGNYVVSAPNDGLLVLSENLFFSRFEEDPGQVDG